MSDLPHPTFIRTVLPAVAAVVVIDQLLAGYSPGWTLGAPPFVGLLLVCWRRSGLLRDPVGLLTALATVVACLLPLHDAGWLAPCLGLIGVALLVLRADGWNWSGAPVACATLLASSMRLPGQVRDDARELAIPRSQFGPLLGLLFGVAWGWLLPLAAAAVFTWLFASANPVIGEWVAGAWSAVITVLGDWWQWLPGPFRVLFWMLLGSGAWWVLRCRVPQVPPVMGPPVAPRDRTAAALRVLATCNLLFLVQTGLDGWYLWGGAHLPHGMGWAEYAHRGAWPLMIAVLLSIALVLWAFRPGGAAERSAAARWLVGLWLAQNGLLVLGAMRRLDLYMDAYGFSTWRLAAGLWMALIGVGLALLLWRILARRGNRWLVDANALATVLALFIAAAVDADGLIAWHNVRHCQEAGGPGPAIDMEYLAELGPGSVPALRWFAGHCTDRTLADQAVEAANGLADEARHAVGDWRGFTVVRAAAGSVNDYGRDKSGPEADANPPRTR